MAENPTKSAKRIKQTCSTPFWGVVGDKKWSRFFVSASEVPFFGTWKQALLPVLEPFLLLYGPKTKSAKWHPKESSNQKVEENKPALKLNFPSKYTRAGSYSWKWISQQALVWFGGISQWALLYKVHIVQWSLCCYKSLCCQNFIANAFRKSLASKKSAVQSGFHQYTSLSRGQTNTIPTKTLDPISSHAFSLPSPFLPRLIRNLVMGWAHQLPDRVLRRVDRRSWPKRLVWLQEGLWWSLPLRYGVGWQYWVI